MVSKRIVALMGFLVVLGILSGVGGVVHAQSLSSSLGVVPYPSKGQTPQQQTNDEGQCYAWARQQTGIDPMAVASAPTYDGGPAVGGGAGTASGAGLSGAAASWPASSGGSSRKRNLCLHLGQVATWARAGILSSGSSRVN
jgi:hypothetical protein